MILLIDNYDSFVFNVEQYLKELTNEEVKTVRNDEITLEGIRELNPDRIVPDLNILKIAVYVLKFLKTLIISLYLVYVLVIRLLALFLEGKLKGLKHLCMEKLQKLR